MEQIPRTHYHKSQRRFDRQVRSQQSANQIEHKWERQIFCAFRRRGCELCFPRLMCVITSKRYS